MHTEDAPSFDDNIRCNSPPIYAISCNSAPIKHKYRYKRKCERTHYVHQSRELIRSHHISSDQENITDASQSMERVKKEKNNSRNLKQYCCLFTSFKCTLPITSITEESLFQQNSCYLPISTHQLNQLHTPHSYYEYLGNFKN